MELCKMKIRNLLGVKLLGKVACSTITVDVGKLQSRWPGSHAPCRYHLLLRGLDGLLV